MNDAKSQTKLDPRYVEYRPRPRAPRPPSPAAAETAEDADRRNLADVLWGFDRSQLARGVLAISRVGATCTLLVDSRLTRDLLAREVTLLRVLGERMQAPIAIELAPRGTVELQRRVTPLRSVAAAQPDLQTARKLSAERRAARKKRAAGAS